MKPIISYLYNWIKLLNWFSYRRHNASDTVVYIVSSFSWYDAQSKIQSNILIL